MAPFRKALGAVKDQTSIGLAKVSSNIAPELDVAIVKATSHDDEPADEKYFREILNLTSYSLGYVNACIATVSKRLNKTRDWIVALKALMLVHRLLSDGDRSFQHEILYATRRGTRILNMSDFRDEAHSNSWDHSAFVRTYALYLDQKLELIIYKKNEGGGGNGGRNGRDQNQRSSHYSDFSEPDPYGSSSYGRSSAGNSGDYRYDDRYKSPSRGDYRYDDRYKSPSHGTEEKKARTPLRELNTERVLGKMHQLQQLLDRFLALRPTGLAKNSRMVLVALYPVVKESFQLYSDLCEILALVLDRFFDMEYPECVKSFDAYSIAAKQIDELVAFYSWCKEIGVARSSEFPEVQRITDNLLETLAEFMRDKARRPLDAPKQLEAPPPEPTIQDEEPVEDTNNIKALPAPNYEEKPVEKVEPKIEQLKQHEGELVNLRDDGISAVDQENRLALALFSAGGATSATNGSWEAFPSSNGGEHAQVTSAWQTPAAEEGKADWELALVETASNLSKQKANLAGGFDPLILNGMYDQGAVKQHVSAQVSGGSASSVALPGKSSKPVLALPAPDGTVQTIGGDPFAASALIPPPSYVQMADIEKKQQMLTQEQLMWQQYAQNGMQGQASLTRLENVYAYPNQAMPYGMPPVQGYYYPSN